MFDLTAGEELQTVDFTYLVLGATWWKLLVKWSGELGLKKEGLWKKNNLTLQLLLVVTVEPSFWIQFLASQRFVDALFWWWFFFGEIAAHSTKHWQRGKVSFLKRKYKNKNKLKFQKPHFYVKSHHKYQNRLLFLATDLASVRTSLWLSGKHTPPTGTRKPSSLKWDYSGPDPMSRLGGVAKQPIFGLTLLFI